MSSLQEKNKEMCHEQWLSMLPAYKKLHTTPSCVPIDIGGLLMILHHTTFIACMTRSADLGVGSEPPLGASHGMGGHRVGLALSLAASIGPSP